MKKIILYFILFIIYSCNSLVEKDIEGSWIIVEFKINNEDHINQLYENYITFRSENNIFVPETKNFNRYQEESYWEVVNGKLIIGTKNILFNDEYEYSFEDNGTYIFLNLTSKDKTIKLMKTGLF